MEEYMPFVWIGIAVVMAVGEAATNQLVSIWFVVGALCAAVSSLITSSVLVQVIVFIVVTCGTLIATKPLVDKYKKGHKEVKTNSDRFIGQTGVMLTDIDTLEAVGQVKVSGVNAAIAQGQQYFDQNADANLKNKLTLAYYTFFTL